MKHVVAFKKLQSLTLRGAGITDISVGTLASLKDLTYLNLWHTDVSPEGIEKLQKSLPKCEIED